MLEIPIVFPKIRKGAHRRFIDHIRLPYYLNLDQSDMTALRDAGLIQQKVPAKIPKMRIDYLALAYEYRRRLHSGESPMKTDLARSMGVNRTWAAKVMKKGESPSTLAL